MSVGGRVILVALGALAVVIGLGALALVRSDVQPQPGPTPAPTPSAAEGILLVQVLDAEGYALGNVVVGVEPAGSPPRAVLLWVPASLLIPVGDDSMTLGTAPSSPDTLASVRGLSEQLALRIDAGLSLDRLAFAGLVDAAGSVTIDVPSRVVLPSADDGTPRTVGTVLCARDPRLVRTCRI